MMTTVMVMMSCYHFVARYHRYCIVSSYHCKHHVLASYHLLHRISQGKTYTFDIST